MSGFQPKRYQQSVLDSVEAYFRACHQYGNADIAFYETTRALWTQGSQYSPIAGFEPDMPYFCLRVPTGGGKTWLAAKSVRLVNAGVRYAGPFSSQRNHGTDRDAGYGQNPQQCAAQRFRSKEEFECAAWLDRQAQQGRIEFWVRNLVRKEGCSFFLQKADGRFYPDFVCKLPDGVILAVEYKGTDRWIAAEEDRLIGGLWEALSGGRYRFVMIRDRNWAGIEVGAVREPPLLPHRPQTIQRNGQNQCRQG